MSYKRWQATVSQIKSVIADEELLRRFRDLLGYTVHPHASNRCAARQRSFEEPVAPCGIGANKKPFANQHLHAFGVMQRVAGADGVAEPRWAFLVKFVKSLVKTHQGVTFNKLGGRDSNTSVMTKALNDEPTDSGDGPSFKKVNPLLEVGLDLWDAMYATLMAGGEGVPALLAARVLTSDVAASAVTVRDVAASTWTVDAPNPGVVEKVEAGTDGYGTVVSIREPNGGLYDIDGLPGMTPIVEVDQVIAVGDGLFRVDGQASSLPAGAAENILEASRSSLSPTGMEPPPLAVFEGKKLYQISGKTASWSGELYEDVRPIVDDLGKPIVQVCGNIPSDLRGSSIVSFGDYRLDVFAIGTFFERHLDVSRRRRTILAANKQQALADRRKRGFASVLAEAKKVALALPAAEWQDKVEVLRRELNPFQLSEESRNHLAQTRLFARFSDESLEQQAEKMNEAIMDIALAEEITAAIMDTVMPTSDDVTTADDAEDSTQPSMGE